MTTQVRLSNNRKPVTITFMRGEKFKLIAHYYIEICNNKAFIRNIFTDVLTKFNDRGYYLVDKKIINRIEKDYKLVCVITN